MRKMLGFINILFLVSVARADFVKKDVKYFSGGRTYEGYLVYQPGLEKMKSPGIIMAHDWMGLTDKTKAQAERLAELGYVVFAVDIYGKFERPKNQEEASKTAGLFKKDRTRMRMRMQDGLKQLRDVPFVNTDKLVAVGYCFGGTAAIELARAGANLKDVVSFHGGLDSPKPQDGKRIKAKILALHGADDPYVPPADVEAFKKEMSDAGVDLRFVAYPGAVHSFTDKTAGNDNKTGAAYNAAADQKSWQEMKNFLQSTLK